MEQIWTLSVSPPWWSSHQVQSLLLPRETLPPSRDCLLREALPPEREKLPPERKQLPPEREQLPPEREQFPLEREPLPP